MMARPRLQSLRRPLPPCPLPLSNPPPPLPPPLLPAAFWCQRWLALLISSRVPLQLYSSPCHAIFACRTTFEYLCSFSATFYLYAKFRYILFEAHRPILLLPGGVTQTPHLSPQALPSLYVTRIPRASSVSALSSQCCRSLSRRARCRTSWCVCCTLFPPAGGSGGHGMLSLP